VTAVPFSHTLDEVEFQNDAGGSRWTAIPEDKKEWARRMCPVSSPNDYFKQLNMGTISPRFDAPQPLQLDVKRVRRLAIN
jgi:hypothetical protein